MLARLWHGVTSALKADSYLEYLHQTGVSGCLGTPGNRGVYVLRRLENGEAHFVLLSFWDSFEAVKQFAGPNPVCARYFPQDKNFLLHLEPTVIHYEVKA